MLDTPDTAPRTTEAIIAAAPPEEQERLRRFAAELDRRWGCVLCDGPVHAVVHDGVATYRVCKAHHDAYCEEGRRYLPFEQREVYRSIIRAGGGDA